MKKTLFLLFGLLGCLLSVKGFAQVGGNDKAVSTPEFLPDAIYETRYWTNMANPYDSKVYIDTMVFFGNERAAFEYTSINCKSYSCRHNDSLIYVVMPKFSSMEKEWVLGKNFVRRMYQVNVNFRGFDRTIYKVYVSDLENRDSGMGDYALVSKQFGIIYRYNTQGEILMLNRIDVIRNGKVMDEIDLLPLHIELGKTDIFTGYD
ncbi:hypothetical protein C7N43_19475 [Sphingobacteriales bacterium UPWRP_1]|nr:hypothetical protein B6N25_01970 [Sphingobacteriales bacterium TSM_CSS]PSJ75324.1 hypothetical protein C7N43_19475 [Sphingobacteriales bacterium UPWRP_1]